MPDTSERMAQSGGQHSGKIHQSPMCSVSFATKAGVCSSPKLELQKLSISKRSLYAACKSGQMFYITAHGSKRQKANVAKLSLKFQPEQSHFCHILLRTARQREPRSRGMPLPRGLSSWRGDPQPTRSRQKCITTWDQVHRDTETLRHAGSRLLHRTGAPHHLPLSLTPMYPFKDSREPFKPHWVPSLLSSIEPWWKSFPIAAAVCG